MYKIKQNDFGTTNVVVRLSDNAFIPFDFANTDYANFKAQIMADEAELQDAEGVTMSPDAAKNFVKELP
jgi:hypothetical protein